MGNRFGFVCQGCSYRAEVSGGRDRTSDSATATIVCLECKKIYDVVVSKNAGDMGSYFGLHCPSGKSSHQLREWIYPDVCPRCGANMIKEKIDI